LCGCHSWLLFRNTETAIGYDLTLQVFSAVL
jgi:hypothetical protein